jgi:TonB family protein
MKRLRMLPIIAIALMESIASAQPATSQPTQMGPKYGVVADRTYTNEFLGFSFPIPEGWEVNRDDVGKEREGEAKQNPSGGLILLVLDQHTENPLRNRMVLSAISAGGLPSTDKFVANFVKSQTKSSSNSVIHDVLPKRFAGQDFFREDFEESYPGGILYKSFICTKFRGFFLGWTLVEDSQAHLQDTAESLERVSFQQDLPEARCTSKPEGPPCRSTDQPSLTGQKTVPSHPLRVRVSERVSNAFLLTTIQPDYPDDARRARIQGLVVLRAEIDDKGNIEDLAVVSGDATLAAAAVSAVRQWKYKPYLLNGQPAHVETQVTVNFQLSER